MLKPDAGQRGSGVAIATDAGTRSEAYLAAARYDVIAQAYVPGVEFGVFYVRRPSEARGRIFAITEKTLPVVAGDGRRTLEELILDDPRAVAMAEIYLDEHADAPRARSSRDGERVQLVELGTHCRGAYFADGAHAAHAGAGGRRSTASAARSRASTSAATTSAPRRSRRSAAGGSR